MGTTVTCFHNIQRRQFRKNLLQKARAMQVVKAYTGMGRHHNLVQFVTNAFTTDNLQSFSIAAKGFKSLVFDIEIQLRGKTHTTQHAQRIIAKSDVGIKRCTNDAVFQIEDAIERIH